MAVWLSETEFRQSGAKQTGVTLNVAFLHEIKEDALDLRQRLLKLRDDFTANLGHLRPRAVVECLYQLRDDLETYFALEECYGYFEHAAVTNPAISRVAGQLRDEHERLYLLLNKAIDMGEAVVYHERESVATLYAVIRSFDTFARQFEKHEQREMDLMLRLCNEEIGVGD
jgi:hypothetical protein